MSSFKKQNFFDIYKQACNDVFLDVGVAASLGVDLPQGVYSPAPGIKEAPVSGERTSHITGVETKDDKIDPKWNFENINLKTTQVQITDKDKKVINSKIITAGVGNTKALPEPSATLDNQWLTEEEYKNQTEEAIKEIRNVEPKSLPIICDPDGNEKVVDANFILFLRKSIEIITRQIKMKECEIRNDDLKLKTAQFQLNACSSKLFATKSAECVNVFVQTKKVKKGKKKKDRCVTKLQTVPYY